MLVKTGDLAPVHVSSFIRFPVEHVRVDPADRKPVLIYPAPTVFKEPTRSYGVILYLQCIAGHIEYAVLVAELGIRSRFECFGIDFTNYNYIPVEKENMAVECTCAAFCASSAPEPDIPYYTGKMMYRILKKGIFLLHQGSDTVGNGGKRNDNHRYVRDRASTNIAFVPSPVRRGMILMNIRKRLKTTKREMFETGRIKYSFYLE